MQLKDNQHIQNKIAEHFGNPSIGALSNAQIVAHSSQKGLLGVDENSNMAQLNQSEAATSDQIVPGDIVVSRRVVEITYFLRILFQNLHSSFDFGASLFFTFYRMDH